MSDVNFCEDKILRGAPSRSPKILKTIGQLFLDLCKKHPDKIFQIEADTGQEETYAQTKEKVVNLAVALQELIKPGDTTLVCSENTIHNIIPILATVFLGGSAASIDPMETVEEIAGAVAYTMPKIVFTEEKSAKILIEAYKRLEETSGSDYGVKFFIIGEGKESIDGAERVEDFAPPTNQQFEIFQGDPFDTAIYVFTSGTTSLPKPVALSHYGVLHGFKCLVDEMENVKPEIMTHFASLYWISAILLTGVTLAHGGTKVIAPNISAYDFMELVEKYKITFAFMSNTYTYDITNLPADVLKNFDTSSLYSIIIGGSPMDPNQLKKVRKMLPYTKVTVAYGSSECAAVSAFDLRDVKAYEQKLLASGQVVANVEVKIVDVETQKLLGPNETGEILVKSPYIMKGYHENCKPFIESPFDEDGFLKTGDLGFYDHDQYLVVTDRINDTFKYKTYQVSPLTIERALLTHPGVAEAVAFNIFHEQDRNHAAALVRLKQNFQYSAEEIEDWADSRLSEKNKLRAGLWIVENIPWKTRTGKVQRAKIREEFSKKLFDV